MWTYFQRHLVAQIGAVVTLVSLASVAFISFATYTSVRETLRQATFDNLQETAQGLDNALQRWLAEQQQDFAERVVNPELAAHVIRLTDQGGESSARRAAYLFLKQQFDLMVEVNLDFQEVALLSARAGEVLVSSSGENEGRFERDSHAFIDGLKAPGVHPLHVRAGNLETCMALTAPIRDDKDMVRGVIMVYLNLDGLVNELHGHPDLYSNGSAYLIDPNHVPVGYLGNWQRDFPRGLHSRGIDAALARETGVEVYDDFHAEEVVGSYRWLENFGAALLVEIPLSRAFYPARHLGWTIFTIGCLGGLLLSGGMTLLARRIVRPVLEVSGAARAVANGDLEVSTLSSGPAEIGVLVASFNDMVRQIHDLLEDVRDREERYRKVFNATGEAIFVHDGNSSRVLDYNEAAKQIYGLGEEEQIDDIAELSAGYPPYASEDAMEKIAAVIKHGPQVFEWRSRRKSGELFWSEVSLSELKVRGERRFLAVVRDIERRKRNEAELEEYRKNLERAIEDRSRQLQEAQDALVSSEKLAVLGQLTATVSHELRNPLGTMSNALYALEAALELGAVDKARKSLQMIDRNIRRCDKIIGELLDFTRRHESEVVATAIDPWLHALLEEYGFPDEVTLREELDGGVEVRIDQESMRRAMINLLDNAVQAMQTDSAYGKLLTVATCVKEGRLEIHVTDEGPGIPVENRQAIFEPLFSTKEFGVGLGVPIIQNVIEKHGGRLDYYSPPGGGTVAVLTLPLRQ